MKPIIETVLSEQTGNGDGEEEKQYPEQTTMVKREADDGEEHINGSCKTGVIAARQADAQVQENNAGYRGDLSVSGEAR